MSQYIIYFHQQWVGEHEEQWFAERGVLANQVVDEARKAGVLILAAGVEEATSHAFSVYPPTKSEQFTSGLMSEDEQYLGGLTVIDVPGEAEAKFWAAKIATACGWPQQLRKLY